MTAPTPGTLSLEGCVTALDSTGRKPEAGSRKPEAGGREPEAEGRKPECTMCGACCVAPDIAALDKPLGVRCPHLRDDNLCGIYESRPPICRSYAADALCDRIAAPTLDERVRKYLAEFGLLDEAARTRGQRSMRSARSLPVLQ